MKIKIFKNAWKVDYIEDDLTLDQILDHLRQNEEYVLKYDNEFGWILDKYYYSED